MKNITDDIIAVGVADTKTDLFEGQYPLPDGILYNSYVVLDEKITVFDAVDKLYSHEWMENVKSALGEKQPDYLVIQHMEPDHSGSLCDFIDAYPNVKIVSNAKVFAMMRQFFGDDLAISEHLVADKDTLCTGKHTFTFIFAPMVHWPEVMVTYDSHAKVLFSADAFGSFGITQPKTSAEWAEEASRYYIGIVGKYGPQVQMLLKKAAALDIEIICSLHGPVIRENLAEYIHLYDLWSSYRPEKSGVCIAYASAYGHTTKAVDLLVEKLHQNGCKDVVVYDLARSDKSKAIADAFRYEKLVLASSTYNMDILPFVSTFIHGLTIRAFQNKKVALIENGSWAPNAIKVMRTSLEKSKDVTFFENTVTIKSALCDTSSAAISALADELCK